MKICPKCKFLDMEDFGPHYECPKCGVIYSRAEEVVRDEKFWKRKGEESYYQAAPSKKQKTDKVTKSKFKFEKMLWSELRPGWTWSELKNGPNARKWNWWLWVAMTVAISLITAVNIKRMVGP